MHFMLFKIAGKLKLDIQLHLTADLMVMHVEHLEIFNGFTTSNTYT